MVSRRSWFFNKFKRGTDAQPLIPTDKLEETVKMLEDKVGVLTEKASQENEKAKKFTRAKNRRVGKALAEKHQKMKKMYDGAIELFGNYQLKIIQQIITFERATATVETVNALRAGDAAMKEMLKANNIADVCNFVDGINEQHTIMGQIEAVVQHPFLDKDELDAKVE